jgi:hypothetical protein
MLIHKACCAWIRTHMTRDNLYHLAILLAILMVHPLWQIAEYGTGGFNFMFWVHYASILAIVNTTTAAYLYARMKTKDDLYVIAWYVTNSVFFVYTSAQLVSIFLYVDKDYGYIDKIAFNTNPSQQNPFLMDRYREAVNGTASQLAFTAMIGIAIFLIDSNFWKHKGVHSSNPPSDTTPQSSPPPAS